MVCPPYQMTIELTRVPEPLLLPGLIDSSFYSSGLEWETSYPLLNLLTSEMVLLLGKPLLTLSGIDVSISC